MNRNEKDKTIINTLVGNISEAMVNRMIKKVDCFLYPKVSLFIPSGRQCEYAITPSHSHPAYAFFYYFQPVSEIIIEDRSFSYDLTDQKCLVAISPGIPHQEIEQDHFESYIAIMIEAELLQDVMKQYQKQIPVFKGEVFTPHPELLSFLRCFMLEVNTKNDDNDILLEHLAQVIIHLIIKSVVSKINQNVLLYDRFEVDRAIAYMNSNFSGKITLKELAEQVQLSIGHFSKIFRKVTDMTPMDFLQMIRLQKARMMLLNSSNKITEIAIECGFNTSSYFSYCFMEKYKMTPSSYRMNFLKQ